MKYCKWCNVEIHNSNIDECDQCWDVRWVCETNPKVVMKIYNASQQNVQADGAICPDCHEPFKNHHQAGGKFFCKPPRR